PDQQPNRQTAKNPPISHNPPHFPPTRTHYFAVVNSADRQPSERNRNHLHGTAPNPSAAGKKPPRTPSAQREINS
ncbi:hypothetical protein, partial [Paraburkholderia fungorum]|uniref:hypothetical protein n=1 Tax=Paraburkholderia fungorum TaxID=134537 RepID=UPI001C3F23EB